MSFTDRKSCFRRFGDSRGSAAKETICLRHRRNEQRWRRSTETEPFVTFQHSYKLLKCIAHIANGNRQWSWQYLSG